MPFPKVILLTSLPSLLITYICCKPLRSELKQIYLPSGEYEGEVSIEGHADERGTREYNLALGERRANAAKDYLMTYGISGKRISVISYGKEKPVNPASSPLAWSQNRRSVTVKVN